MIQEHIPTYNILQITLATCSKTPCVTFNIEILTRYDIRVKRQQCTTIPTVVHFRLQNCTIKINDPFAFILRFVNLTLLCDSAMCAFTILTTEEQKTNRPVFRSQLPFDGSAIKFHRPPFSFSLQIFFIWWPVRCPNRESGTKNSTIVEHKYECAPTKYR